jgi:hypothetical protein
MPPGAGLDALLISQQLVDGQPRTSSVNLISYAAPSIIGVSGCGTQGIAQKLENCGRSGGDVITIYGADFLDSGASVKIGSTSNAPSVVHVGDGNLFFLIFLSEFSNQRFESS